MLILPKTYILSPLFCFSKKRLFEEIAGCAAFETGQKSKQIVDSLNQREKSGTTFFFDGIALPHAVIDAKSSSFAILSILDKPIQFNSIDADTKLIDISYSVFISRSENYENICYLLKNITEVLSNTDLLNSIRLARNETSKIEKILNQIDLLLMETHYQN